MELKLLVDNSTKTDDYTQNGNLELMHHHTNLPTLSHLTNLVLSSVPLLLISFLIPISTTHTLVQGLTTSSWDSAPTSTCFVTSHESLNLSLILGFPISKVGMVIELLSQASVYIKWDKRWKGQTSVPGKRYKLVGHEKGFFPTCLSSIAKAQWIKLIQDRITRGNRYHSIYIYVFRAFPISIIPQLSSTQSNPYSGVVCLGVAYSSSLQTE